MLEFIKISYCVSIPLLLLVSWLSYESWKKYSVNLISISNILLIGYSFYLGWQLLAIYRLAKQFSVNHPLMEQPLTGIIGPVWVCLLPLLSLHSGMRRNRLFTMGMVGLLFSVFPPFSWNVYDIGFKIPAYFCLMCSAYALLWLLNQLPHQSRPQ